MQEIDLFDAEISVIPNGLEKFMAFTINTNLGVFWQHAIYEL